MAGFLGLAAGAGIGYVGDKYRAKQQEDQFYKNLELKSLIELPHTDPERAMTPEFKTQLLKKLGKEHGEMAYAYIQPQAAAAVREKKQMNDMLSAVGLHALTGIAPNAGQPSGGGGMGVNPPSGGAPPFNQPQQLVQGGAPSRMPQTSIEGPSPAQAAPPAQPQASSPTDKLDTEQQQIEAAQLAVGQMKFASPETIKSYQKVLDQHMKDIDERRKQAMEQETARQKERDKVAFENSPEIVKQRAATQAAIGSARGAGEARGKLAPDIVAGEARAGALKTSEETSARLAVENLPKNVAAKVDLATKDAQARVAVQEGKSGNPTVEAGRAATRFNTLLSSYVKLRPPPASSWTGVRVTDETNPRMVKWYQGFDEFLAQHGLGPNGEIQEKTATGPNGEKLVLRGGKWVPK